MTKKDKVIIKFTSQYEKYEVIDTIYNGRVARLLILILANPLNPVLR